METLRKVGDVVLYYVERSADKAGDIIEENRHYMTACTILTTLDFEEVLKPRVFPLKSLLQMLCREYDLDYKALEREAMLRK